jgi:uncharacterized protein YbgA (DUF1722 family)
MQVKQYGVLSDRELGTVLAALRAWQKADAKTRYNSEFTDIANNFGSFDDALEDDEIDALCQQLNLGITKIAIA